MISGASKSNLGISYGSEAAGLVFFNATLPLLVLSLKVPTLVLFDLYENKTLHHKAIMISVGLFVCLSVTNVIQKVRNRLQ